MLLDLKGLQGKITPCLVCAPLRVLEEGQEGETVLVCACVCAHTACSSDTEWHQHAPPDPDMHGPVGFRLGRRVHGQREGPSRQLHVGDALTSRKLGALNLVPLLDLPPEACVKLLLAGASNPQEAVSRRGDELLKKWSAPGLSLAQHVCGWLGISWANCAAVCEQGAVTAAGEVAARHAQLLRQQRCSLMLSRPLAPLAGI